MSPWNAAPQEEACCSFFQTSRAGACVSLWVVFCFVFLNAVHHRFVFGPGKGGGFNAGAASGNNAGIRQLRVSQQNVNARLRPRTLCFSLVLALSVGIHAAGRLRVPALLPIPRSSPGPFDSDLCCL